MYVWMWFYSYYNTNIVTLFWVNVYDGDKSHNWWVTLVPVTGGYQVYSTYANGTQYNGKYSSVIPEAIGKWQYMEFYFDRPDYTYSPSDTFRFYYYDSSNIYWLIIENLNDYFN